MTKKQISISVTGAAGFIGSHLVKRFILENFKVGLILDSFSPSYGGEWCNYRQKFLVPEVKISNINLLEENANSLADKLGSTDILLHFAAFPGVRQGELESHRFLKNNVNSSSIVIDAARLNKNIKAIIFASSSSVYGDLGLTKPSKEIDANGSQIKSNYSMTKWINEIQFSFWQKKLNIPIIGLRFFTVFGQWGRPDMAYFKFTKSILENIPIQIYNYGLMKRDFTYIDDIVKGILAVLERIPTGSLQDCSPFNLFNIGHNKPVDLIYFIELLEQLTGKKAIKEYLPLQPGDVTETYADITEFTPSGQKSASRDQIELLAIEGNQEVKNLAHAVLQQRKADKLANTYFKNFMEKHVDGFVHPSVKTLGARTSRMSITDPALQTLPKGDDTVRTAFIPKDENHVIVTSDLDQVEFRMFASLSGDTNLINLLGGTHKEGLDICKSNEKSMLDADPH
jgi:UDP-glucuronate 4-epimerase